MTLPKAYHSWVLTTPWTFADLFDRLITDDRLGPELRNAVPHTNQSGSPSGNSDGMYRNEALVRSLTPTISNLGNAYPPRRRMYHRYRIWDLQEVADFALKQPAQIGSD